MEKVSVMIPSSLGVLKEVAHVAGEEKVSKWKADRINSGKYTNRIPYSCAVHVAVCFSWQPQQQSYVVLSSMLAAQTKASHPPWKPVRDERFDIRGTARGRGGGCFYIFISRVRLERLALPLVQNNFWHMPRTKTRCLFATKRDNINSLARFVRVVQDLLRCQDELYTLSYAHTKIEIPT